ncbi:MAG: glutamate 2,3-aminomutase [Tenericutes bacterium]|nr:glutamate 2,3-aminomutase [Mycoplasmatota bacterium]
MKTKRQVSLARSKELKSRIADYLEAKKSISKGLEMEPIFIKRKKEILKILEAKEENWNDWHWQLRNRIKDVETLSRFFDLSAEEIEEIQVVSKVYRWAISPYYLSMIDQSDLFDPIRLLAIPCKLELLDFHESLDPMAEEYTNPSGAITRRYPDRLIINVTNECAMYCRHCQRRRNIGSKDRATNKTKIIDSIEYIRQNEEIRDVLITGGDPLTLTNQNLEWILKELKNIPHVEIIRIGSRTPVTMPQRITDKLVKMLSKYHPIYLNTHFNHPKEITKASKIACEKLSNAGITLGNQAVLLNGINNDKFIMRCLNQELLKIRVRPYYIFHAKKVKGTHHFQTSIDDGLEIMEHLRGFTSGLAIPTYIVNAPNGLGKTPILPQYLISRGKDYVTIKTWEGNVIKYINHPTEDIKSLKKQV